MKVCCVCKEEKPMDDFYIGEKYLGGRNPACKKCINERNRRWAAKNREKVLKGKREYRQRNKEEFKERDRLYKLNNLDRCREVVREWYQKNKEEALSKKREYYYKNKEELMRKKVESGRNKVYCKVRYYLKKGILVKPKVCPYCGEKKVIHGHHHDYSKPLEVDWSCSLCHKSRHHSKLVGVNNELSGK